MNKNMDIIVSILAANYNKNSELSVTVKKHFTLVLLSTVLLYSCNGENLVI